MKRHLMMPRRMFLLIAALAVALTGGVVWAIPPDGVLDHTHASVRAAMAVQQDVTADLMSLEGVLGTAVGLDDTDQVALVVYLDRDSTKMADVVRALPPRVRGVGVKVEVTDKFRAFAGKDKPAAVSHTAKQTPPIQLGTSGGWGGDLANGYCCGGTLGCLVWKNGKQYILSNYHVLEADIVDGENDCIAAAGNPVIQPGLIDVSCNFNNAQSVATLSGIKSLPGSNVDAALAEVIENMVRLDGAILEIGTVSSQTVAAFLNQKVKKSGRTTRLTRSTISGLNATINITYENECAGVVAFTKTFTGQIIIANRGSKFLAGGDSGSLLVEDVGTNPRAVGLLFAGSSMTAIANPIDDVLTVLGATMVGQ